ncbi:ABC transporter ATP-binding protein [Devosia sp.]|uniref:ABC transporter ATP-binding protein n=1 Tax=Devosia sp. TaxID=1871048 RepID=UPI002EFC7F0C
MIRTFGKLAELLDRRERRQALALLALMLAMGLAEVAGVASILPLIAVLADPEIIQTSPYLRQAYELFGFADTNAFLILLSAGVFALVVVRTGLAAFTGYALLRYAHMRGHAISARLLSSYLRRKYEWFLNRHSADIGHSVLSEVDQVITGSLMPALQLVSQAIIAACLVALVVAVEPLVALVATATIGLAYGLVYFSIRSLLLRVGRERLEANRERFQIAQEVLGGVKEVKVGGLERGYLRRFASASLQHARRRTTQMVLSEIPRNFLEVVAIGGMLAVIIALLLRNDGRLEAALPVIALYAFAGVRLLPVVQNLYRSVVSLRAGQPALDALHADLFEPVAVSDLRDDQPPLALNDAIELRGVSFSYPQAERLTLRDIDLTIRAHTTVGFVGATGAGKSTVIDLILGLLEPRQGQLLVDGRPIGDDNVRAWQKCIGYVPQQIFLADESVAANIAFGVPPGQIDMAAVERAARMAMLHDFVTAEMPQGYLTPIGERGVRLSGGQRQRVGIARALYHDPDVLVLDEATSALDNLTERAVMEAVNHLAHRKTILIIAHRLTTVKGCDRIVLMQAGQISAVGTYDELAGSSPEFRRIAGAA